MMTCRLGMTYTRGCGCLAPRPGPRQTAKQLPLRRPEAATLGLSSVGLREGEALHRQVLGLLLGQGQGQGSCLGFEGGWCQDLEWEQDRGRGWQKREVVPHNGPKGCCERARVFVGGGPATRPVCKSQFSHSPSTPPLRPVRPDFCLQQLAPRARMDALGREAVSLRLVRPNLCPEWTPPRAPARAHG